VVGNRGSYFRLPSCLTTWLAIGEIPSPLTPLQQPVEGSEYPTWNELPAAIARLAGGWCLATLPLRFAGLAGALRTNRLVTGSGGRQPRSGQFLGGHPTDRAKLGSKRHLICDGRGVPLAIQLAGANRNDSQQALSLVDAIPLLRECADAHAIVRTAY
jgi:hypothetical protein